MPTSAPRQRPYIQRHKVHRDSWHAVCSVRSELRLPRTGAWKWSQPFGVTAGGKPYVLCTTCHNQHVMTVYTSSAASPIANDGGGKWYATFFFVNGPYNPNLHTLPPATRRLRRRSSAVSATLAKRTKPTTPTTSPRNSSRIGGDTKGGEFHSPLFFRILEVQFQFPVLSSQ
jgi:hypothetical protein